jgi:hypothetical protein
MSQSHHSCDQTQSATVCIKALIFMDYSVGGKCIIRKARPSLHKKEERRESDVLHFHNKQRRHSLLSFILYHSSTNLSQHGSIIQQIFTESKVVGYNN